MEVPLYLTLLNLHNDSAVALKAIRYIISGGSDLSQQVVALLNDLNWRPQLVGATAIGLGAGSTDTIAALWQAIDSGSWTSPQLGAIAFLVDPDFQHNAKTRIEKGCPLNRERLEGLDWIERHVAAGPESFNSHSSKSLSALLALCHRLPESSEWLEPIQTRDDIHKIAIADQESGEIAIQWLDGFTKMREVT